MGSKETKEKIEKTNIEKYGSKVAIQNKEVTQKMIQTNLKKYGYKSSAQQPDVKAKQIKTSIERYGFKSPLQNNEIKEKMKQTNLENWNVEWTSQNKEVREKQIQTTLERYGTDCILKLPAVHKKVVTHQRTISWNIRKPVIEKDFELLFSDKEIITNGFDKKYKVKCKKCGTIFETNFLNGITKCPTCKITNLESQIKEFLDNNRTEYKQWQKIPGTRYEMDFYIPAYKLAIEVNGLRWHSELFKDNNNYHQDKVLLAKKNGIHLIHIWEDWINDSVKFEIIKSIINCKLNNCKKIYARNTKVCKVSNNECYEFLERNHIQGYSTASIRLGLRDKINNKLLQVMTFSKPRYSKNIQWELIRNVTKLNTVVVGGSSKLFKHFIIDCHPKSIISFCSLDLFNGNSYEKFGFTFKRITKPNYFYDINGKRLSRIRFQKHKLKDFLKDRFNPNLTEVENMHDNGYYRIFDSGNKVFIWKQEGN